MEKVCLLLTLVAVAYGAAIDNRDDPKRCCGDKFTGRYIQAFTSEYDGQVTAALQEGEMVGDNTIDKMFVNTTGVELKSGVKTQYSYYWFGEDTYTVIPALQLCIKSKAINTKYRCIPDSAVFLGERKYGDSTVGTNKWFYEETKEGVYKYGVTMTVTKDTCFPVEQTARFVAEGKGVSQFHLTMSDVSAEVKDPSVFDLPDYCNQVALNDIELLEAVHKHPPRFF